MKAKKVVFFDIVLRDFVYPRLDCTVHCSTGTYIRSFAHDLGQKLGCGGYVQELRRTRIAAHLIEDAVELKTLTPENCRQFLQPPEKFLKDWQCLEVTPTEYQFLHQGGFIRNRWENTLAADKKTAGVKAPTGSQMLALYEGQTVGMLELCEEGKSVKFAKRFNLG